MLKSSFQEDTLKTDSIAIPVSADTIKPDTSAKEVKTDSIVSPQKRDSISLTTEKKTSVKVKHTDSIASQKISVLIKDTPAPTPDTSFYQDTFSIIQEQKKDTHTTNSQVIKRDEKFSPQKIREEQNSGWALLLFFLIFSLLAWTKVVYSKRLKQMLEAFLSNRYIRQLVREEVVFSHPSSIVLNIVFLFTSSLLLVQTNDYFQWNIFSGSTVAVFFKILFSLTLFYTVKIFFIRASGILFSIGEEMTEYLFNIFLFNNILGLLLLPLAMGVLYAKSITPQNIILVSGVLALLAFLFRIAKSVFLGISSTRFSWSYIILYICTLEILPAVVIIKTFSGNILK